MTTGQTDLWTLAIILGLAVVTVIARSFFFISRSHWHLPRWAERGLHYAPIAALTAVIAPEIVMTQGQLISSLHDARVYGALAGAAAFWWRRNTLDCIIAGMLVYLPLRLLLGW
jgi:branched-subunit amino acid transport protein